MNDVDKNYKWYKDNFNKLVKKYNNQFLLISDKKVIYSSKNEKDVITYASEMELGTFIIHKCVKHEENNFQIFQTRAIF